MIAFVGEKPRAKSCRVALAVKFPVFCTLGIAMCNTGAQQARPPFRPARV